MRLSQFSQSPGWLTPLNDSLCPSLDFSLSLFHCRNSPSIIWRERRKIQLTRRMIAPGVIYILTGPRITGISVDLLENSSSRNYRWISRSSVGVRKNSITNPDTIKHTSLTLTLKEITRHISTALPSRLYFRATRETRAQSRFTVINRQTGYSGSVQPDD